MVYDYKKPIEYEVEVIIGDEIYYGFMELNSRVPVEIDLPTIEGMGRSPRKRVLIGYNFSKNSRTGLVPRYDDEVRKCDAKHCLTHNSTRVRLMHRKGRLAKLLN
ncbi:hypothetical protein HYT25_02080 [Candidatus Pacearchaeota archaeon]|nr:hypothetical protein [Candidatus Pacearchaeota archaeon]